ncbi:MAG: hypothetical protein ACE5FW_03060 [Candidatus Aenigmatarchaeota archaeon]
MEEVCFTKGKEAYYNEAAKILESSSTFKALAKTPTLFISSQRRLPHQKAYYKKLMEAIESGGVAMEYIFSLPLTQEEILNIASSDQRQALSDLGAWDKFSNHPKIDLRYMEGRNPFSCVIGDKHTAVLFVYPGGERGCMTVLNERVPFYMEVFSQLFKGASRDNRSAIARVGKLV